MPTVDVPKLRAGTTRSTSPPSGATNRCAFDAVLARAIMRGMTKTENRAAAKAWHAEREAQRREIARAQAAKADLAELDRLRRYLIFHMKSRVTAVP